jgi:S-DNA-T family DNA segregation ATPase FtsK/SpoIIIE
VVGRPAREPGPPLPAGELELQEPPVLPEAASADLSSAMMYWPMGLSTGAMVLMFSSAAAGPTAYLASGMMGISGVGMLLGQLGRTAGERRRRLRAARRDYLRHLAQARKTARAAREQQRRAVGWDHPAPGQLWGVARGHRLWQRRPMHEDFAEIRIGTGTHPAALKPVPPRTTPVEDLEPLCTSALRRFMRAWSTVADLPTAVSLRSFPRATVSGPADQTRALARSVLAQLATFHAPDELRIAVLTDRSSAAEWEWVKWLPHALHPIETDDAGAMRLVVRDHDGLMRALGAEFTQRRPFDPTATPGASEPFLVVLVDGDGLDERSPLAASGWRNTVMVDLTPDRAADRPLRIDVTAEGDMTVADESGATAAGRVDGLSRAESTTLAELLTPLQTAGGALHPGEALETDFGLARLLGIQDPHTYDVPDRWRARSQLEQLRVPIGLYADGAVVELDIKESAPGGMGSHGVLIGATGSGKSELLRTVVIALAVTQSPEALNFVLVDFKGGATFLGLDALPLTSAVITNFADELAMVDHMQGVLHGELMLRQELLRATGNSWRPEYENARGHGAALDPLPTLFVVCDEFSELPASKPDFIDLFVMIGRLGRSLGVHLLLASQRLDEGRIQAMESHLSYRMALRTFSSMESRSVIGVAGAHSLPSAPGNGFLKISTSGLTRCKAGCVSGPCRSAATPTVPVGGRDVFGYDVERTEVVPAPDPVAQQPEPATPDAQTDSLLSVLVGRLAGHGPQSRQVWLPPLTQLPTVDSLLPGLMPDPAHGLQSAHWPGRAQLRVPVGVVDCPFEQVRDLLLADLSGAAGHVAIVGAPQSGKSTLVRTLLLSLALTHTPWEVQFYCLDFGGGALGALAALLQVGSVAWRFDRDRVHRTVAQAHALLERREREFAQLGVESVAAYRMSRRQGGGDPDYGDVFLVVDGSFTLRQEFEELAQRIAELATRGLGYGIHVVVTASRWSEVRPWLRDLAGTRSELRLGDPLESEIGSRQAAGVPAMPGRGLTPQAQHFLAALPRVGGIAEIADVGATTMTAVEEIGRCWTGPRALEVRLLAARLPITELPAPRGDLRIAVGWDDQQSAPVWHDFAQTPHLMVFGDGESGKTNLLELVVLNVISRYRPAEARAAAPRSATAADLGFPPQIPVPLLLGAREPCARFAAAAGSVALTTVAAQGNAGVPTTPGAGDGRIADRVVAAPGAGIFAAVATGPGVVTADRYLIDDLGIKYPLSPDAVAAFGYDNVTAVAVSTELLALLPTGPTLDPAAALAG